MHPQQGVRPVDPYDAMPPPSLGSGKGPRLNVQDPLLNASAKQIFKNIQHNTAGIKKIQERIVKLDKELASKKINDLGRSRLEVKKQMELLKLRVHIAVGKQAYQSLSKVNGNFSKSDLNYLERSKKEILKGEKAVIKKLKNDVASLQSWTITRLLTGKRKYSRADLPKLQKMAKELDELKKTFIEQGSNLPKTQGRIKKAELELGEALLIAEGFDKDHKGFLGDLETAFQGYGSRDVTSTLLSLNFIAVANAGKRPDLSRSALDYFEKVPWKLV